jgi:hypothetical protein
MKYEIDLECNSDRLCRKKSIMSWGWAPESGWLIRISSNKPQRVPKKSRNIKSWNPGELIHSLLGQIGPKFHFVFLISVYNSFKIVTNI